jgi:hypothetical protein
MGFQECIAFTILVPWILSMWPSQLILFIHTSWINADKSLLKKFSRNVKDIHHYHYHYYYCKYNCTYLYCCTVHLVDSLNITLPTNALIICHLF